MVHPIPVQATASPGFAPLDDLVLDLYQVTQDGRVVSEIGRFPVVDGVAQVEAGTLPEPMLRWAIRLTDVATAAPVYRSGPLAALPGGLRRFPVGDRIRIHRGGGHLGLDAPDGAPQALVDHVRDHLPTGWRLRRLELGADAEGRYVITFEGRFAPVPFLDVEVTYRRRFRIAPGLDPGRPRRVAVAWPQGPAEPPGLPMPGAAAALDAVLAGGVEAQMTAMAAHVGWLMLFAAGVTDLSPQTVSLNAIALADLITEVGCSVTLCAGALAGGIRVFEPAPPVAATVDEPAAG